MKSKTKLIVVTGGPGAGKTAVLEYMRKIVCPHVAILPEAAGILFSGGFWRLSSPSAVRAGQKAIFHVQQEMQNLVIGEKKWTSALCDRGLLDGIAYWPGPASEFYKALTTTKEKEYLKYAAVIQLQSPSLELGYNKSNPIRTESAELAAAIDKKIHLVWKHHPQYVFIESSTSFIDKVDRAAKVIQSFIPNCNCANS